MATPLYEKEAIHERKSTLTTAFVTRRLHSLLGLWLTIYTFEHLLVNSQAALYFYDDGAAFVSMVNKIHAMPYLKAIEIIILGLPFLFHGLWGIAYARSAKMNSFGGKKREPYLPQYAKNRAFTWQRITSWLLLVGIIAHVVHMRFVEYPTVVHRGSISSYLLVQKKSDFLYMMSDKWNIHLFDAKGLELQKEKMKALQKEEEDPLRLEDRILEDEEWLRSAMHKKLQDNQVLIEAPSAGVAFLLIVRDAFTHPMIVILYSILVLAAAFHGFNGLWTAMIKWGVVITRRSQRRLRYFTNTLMAIVIFFGLFAAWGSYLL